MKFASLTGLMFLCLLLTATAQMQVGLNKDSLKKVLSNQPDDSLKARTLITLGQQYESSQPDSAVYYYQLSNQLSQQLHYPAGVVRYIANYTAVLNVQGKFDESLKLNLQAVELSRKAGLKQQLVKSLMNTGAVYQYKEDYASAAHYYLQALPLLEAAGSTQNLSLAYGNLCGLYRNLKQSQKALTYGRLSLKYAESDHDLYATASACINVGNALKDVGAIKESINYMTRAHDIGKKINDENSQETALIGLADAYLQLNQPDRYIGYFRQALPLAEAIEDVSGKAYALNGICLGLFWQKKYPDAEKLLNSSMLFVQRHDQKEVWNKMLLLMSDVQIAMGKAENSRIYRSRYDSISNILLNAPLLKNIQELETKYGLEKKQREILQKNLLLEQKERETQRQRQWLIVTGAGMVFLALLVLLIYRFYLQKQQLNTKALQVLKAEQESERLKAVLEGEQQERRRISQELHDDMGAGLTRMLFLSRTMGTPNETSGKIAATAEELIGKMNEVIWTMSDEQDTLDSLVAYIRATTADMLENAGINYTFQVNEPMGTMPLNREFRRNVYLAVKEAVHNVIKHAAASHVQIIISNNGKLEILVQDNGKGFENNGQRRVGNGMKNMQSRMEQLNGSMEVLCKEGTQVRFVVPLPV
ncbi:tetratricopeptide repeat-containing sensor histidine kinase [Mucilaginibacter lappiensis]|uniref:tetratricopeptide repeat-containing sensor histidine kinase n=1 Tax=Mucilaginibacter lappiensis TaxID=354630 RepID=UPI003D242120